jgi:hypothetical protein
MPMPPSTPLPDRVPIPRWAVLAGSLLIVFHLGTVAIHVVAAPSGPWPGMEGSEPAPPPQFSAFADEKVAAPYLTRLKMTHNYHFVSNRPGVPGAYLEIKLLDRQGETLKTVQFPDPTASSAVRRRQALAIRWFTEDRPIQPPQAEKIPAPGEKIPDAFLWKPVEGEMRKLDLAGVPEIEIDRNRPVAGPSEWSLLVLRSFVRHLCRVHGADSAEVVRKSREPIPPRILFEREVPPLIDLLESNYGGVSR